MSDNISIKDSNQQEQIMKTTEDSGVHTPHHKVTDGTTVAGVHAGTAGLKTYDVSNTYVKETLSTSADVVLGSVGAIGDKLSYLYFPTAIAEDIVVMDGAIEVFTIPTALITAGFKMILDVVSLSGAWKIKTTTASTANIVAVGRFS